MADRYKLFGTPMILALMAGRKTQTRRLDAPAIEETGTGAIHVHDRFGGIFAPSMKDALDLAVDYLPMAVGDRVCVREAWRTSNRHDATPPRDLEPCTLVHYEADGMSTGSLAALDAMTGRLRASMHMPRWASRLTLVVTDVRVERLQDISEEDAEAEGFPRVADDLPAGRIKDWYRDLWEAINGAGSWAANPFVAAYTFDIHKKNIDQL